MLLSPATPWVVVCAFVPLEAPTACRYLLQGDVGILRTRVAFLQRRLLREYRSSVGRENWDIDDAVHAHDPLQALQDVRVQTTKTFLERRMPSVASLRRKATLLHAIHRMLEDDRTRCDDIERRIATLQRHAQRIHERLRHDMDARLDSIHRLRML